MRMFLCLKDLFMDSGVRCFTAGRLYRECSAGAYNDHNEPHYGIGTWGVFVETFERDNVTWIKHDGGDCPVPGEWRVEFSHESGGHILGRSGLLARLFCWGPIVAYRILSTCEPEESGAGGGIEDSGHGENTNIGDTVEVKSFYSDWVSAPCGSSTYYRSDSLDSVTDCSGTGWHNIELGAKDESELNDDNPDMSMMDNLTPSQREYWNKKEYEQHQREQAEERARQDKMEHDKEVADSI